MEIIISQSHPSITRGGESKALSDLPPRFWVQRPKCKIIVGKKTIAYRQKMQLIEQSYNREEKACMVITYNANMTPAARRQRRRCRLIDYFRGIEYNVIVGMKDIFCRLQR